MIRKIIKFLLEGTLILSEIKHPIEFAFKTIPSLFVLIWCIGPMLHRFRNHEELIRWVSDEDSLGWNLAYPLLLLGAVVCWHSLSSGWWGVVEWAVVKLRLREKEGK